MTTKVNLDLPVEILSLEMLSARSLAENLGIGICLVDSSLRILAVNHQMEEWHTDIDFSIHPFCYEFFDEADRDHFYLHCPAVKTFQDGRVHESASDIKTSIGFRHFRFVSSPIFEEDESIQNVIIMVEDITEKVRLQRELSVSNQILDSAHFGILITDLKGCVIYINPFLKKIARWDNREDIVGKPIALLTKTPIAVEKIIRTIVEKGNYQDIYTTSFDDGSPLEIWHDSRVVFDIQGRPLHLLGMMIDITARKQTEASLYLYRNIVENSQEAIFICDPEGKIVSANPAFLELLGINFSDNGEKNIWEYLPAQTQVIVENVVLPRVTTGESWEGEFILTRSDGVVFPAWGRAGGIRDTSGALTNIFVFMHDITKQTTLALELQRSRAELEQRVKERTKALQQSELELRALLDAIPESALMVDRTGKILSNNATFAQRFGLAGEHLIDKNIYDLLPPDLAAERKERLESVFQTGNSLRFIDKRFGRWMDNTVYPVLNEKGEVMSVAILGIDVTERINASQALEEKANELTRSNAELEQFAYVASHDLQEPLRMVTSYLQLIEKTYNDLLDQDGREYIQFAVDGAKRMNTLIRDLLTFSRVGTRGKEFSHVEMAEVLSRVTLNMKILIEDTKANIDWDHMPRVWADSTQMEQLFQNLVINAIKFHGDKPPRIHISCQKRKEDWLFSVQDHGIGIDPRHAERIFVIFQRLHRRDEYPGTGIGLAICKKIVERHGGRIWVDSLPDKGSTFFFTIPRKEGD